MANHRFALGALNQIPMDWEGNLRRIEEAIQSAKNSQSSFLILPEMSICGYGCEDVYLSEYLYDLSLDMLERILPQTKAMAVVLGLPLLHEGKRYVASALLVDSKLEAIYCKKNLAGDGLHYEPRWFQAWPAGLVETASILGRDIPIGDISISFDNLSFGFEICEDAWVEERKNGSLASSAVDLIVNISASHFAFQKQATRRELVRHGSEIFDSAYLYVNMCANEAGRIIYDGSCLAAQKGQILLESERFSFHEVQMHAVVMSFSDLKQSDTTHKISWSLPESSEQVSAPSEARDLSNEEEFVLAETLGLFDYMRKSYSRGFVLSLSGGVDSACCAVLVYYMAKRAISELGLKGFKKRLAYFSEIQDCESLEKMMPHLLLTVYQATKNSGPVTENAAQKLAEATSAEYYFFNVDEVLQGYHDLVEGSLGRKLAWETDDLALQNIQARVRAPGVWMLSNVRGALLLTTSNRSEAAVGYATMDGDTSGGLCPLGGVDKTFLRSWLRHAEKSAFGVLPALPALSLVNEQEPTAELRPQGSLQKDEEDLMPYQVLDFIEKASIRDKRSPRDIFYLLQQEYSEINKEQIFAWLTKFCQLWSRNQWKRERYAPSFHMDDENLDPKTWCRFPILSGSYIYELKCLREELNLEKTNG